LFRKYYLRAFLPVAGLSKWKGQINPDGYNIIMQGDIIKAVEMHPNERRQLIEEISGISIYEEKKIKAIRELENVEQRLKEAEIILAERATHLKELKNDRDEALKFKEMNNRIKESKATLISIRIEKREDEKKLHLKRMEECNTELNLLKGKIDKLKQETHEKRQEIEKITKEIIKSCDVIVAEVSYPSTGQGIELGWATVFEKPIICIFKKDHKYSHSLNFITNQFIEYSNADELISKLTDKLDALDKK